MGGAGGRGGSGGAGGISGRGGSDAGRDVGTPTEVRPGQFALVVLPAVTPPLPVGRSFRLRALVELDGVWRDLGADEDLVWETDNAAVAEVTPRSGRVTGITPGRTNVRARHPLFGMATSSVTVTESRLLRVVVEPPAVALRVGEMRDLVAQAIYDDGTGAVITDSASWGTSDQRIVRVETTAPPLGRAVGVTSGVAVIDVEFSGARTMVPVVVSPSGMQSLSIAPMTSTIPIGGTSRFQALLRQPSGNSTDVSGIAAWTSSVPAVASSLGIGQFRCRAAGMTVVGVSHLGLAATAQLACASEVNTVRELRIEPPCNSPLPVGQKFRISLIATNTNGSLDRVGPNQFRWNISDPTVASIETDGSDQNLIGLRAGTVTIGATYRELMAQESCTFFTP